MGLAPQSDVLVVVAIGDRPAHRQKQKFGQRVGDAMRLARILDEFVPRRSIRLVRVGESSRRQMRIARTYGESNVEQMIDISINQRALNTAVICKLAGSITARTGCPLPVRGMVSN